MVNLGNLLNEQKIMQQIEELKNLLQIQEKRTTQILVKLDKIEEDMQELKNKPQK